MVKSMLCSEVHLVSDMVSTGVEKWKEQKGVSLKKKKKALLIWTVLQSEDAFSDEA